MACVLVCSLPWAGQRQRQVIVTFLSARHTFVLFNILHFLVSIPCVSQLVCFRKQVSVCSLRVLLSRSGSASNLHPQLQTAVREARHPVKRALPARLSCERRSLPYNSSDGAAVVRRKWVFVQDAPPHVCDAVRSAVRPRLSDVLRQRFRVMARFFSVSFCFLRNER